MFICKFCQKECKNSNSRRNHERLCKNNPDRQTSAFEDRSIQANKKKSNQYTKAAELGLVAPTLSEESRKLISAKAAEKRHTVESKKKLSIAAKKNGLGGHTSKRKIFFEKKNGEKVYLQSSYEEKFALILEELDLEWERPPPFMWKDDAGIEHRYYPDFKVMNVYFDTKNDYLVIKDALKIRTVVQQNDVEIKVVTFENITKEYILQNLPF